MLSGQFRYLHPYVSQRLVSLFETLAKKHGRLDTQLGLVKAGDASVVSISGNLEDMVRSFCGHSIKLILIFDLISSYKIWQYWKKFYGWF